MAKPTDHSRILEFIARCSDAKQLRSIHKNARDRKETEVADAAFRRLISLVPTEQPGTVEHDFWRTVHAYEQVLTEERGKTARLSRTRQKVARVGVMQTLADWALGRTETEGFRMLMERGMPEYLGEAIVLRHAALFDPAVVSAARKRLEGAGVDLNALPQR
jgi:hypothetical protein